MTVSTVSHHAQERMAQRNIDLKHINFAVRCGTRIDSDNDATLFCVGREHLSRGGQRLPRGLNGVVVVMSKDGTNTVITVYRDYRWHRHFKSRAAA